jgi:hypothetical protein
LAIYQRGGEGGEGGWLEGRKDDNWSRVLANGQQKGQRGFLGLLRRGKRNKWQWGTTNTIGRKENLKN